MLLTNDPPSRRGALPLTGHRTIPGFVRSFDGMAPARCSSRSKHERPLAVLAASVLGVAGQHAHAQRAQRAQHRAPREKVAKPSARPGPSRPGPGSLVCLASISKYSPGILLVFPSRCRVSMTRSKARPRESSLPFFDWSGVRSETQVELLTVEDQLGSPPMLQELAICFFRTKKCQGKVLLNNLVSKTLRRSLLAGDVVYELHKGQQTKTLVATVRVYGLEEDQPLEFAGSGGTQKEAELRAAEAALAALPRAPSFEPRYPKPQDAAAWVTDQLKTMDTVELDSTMADVLPTLAHLPASLQTTAWLGSALWLQTGFCKSFNLEEPAGAGELELPGPGGAQEEPCRVVVSKGFTATLPKEVRSILVSRTTEGGKLAAAMRARLLGEDGRSYEALELKMAGKSACREAAIATKILQRFFPEELCISFWARFQHFEGYRALGLVLSVVKLRKAAAVRIPGLIKNIEHITVDATRAGMVVLTKMLPLKQKYVLPEAGECVEQQWSQAVWGSTGFPKSWHRTPVLEGLRFTTTAVHLLYTCALRDIWISKHFQGISRRSHFTYRALIAMVIAALVLWATTFSAWADENCLLQAMPSHELQVEVKSKVTEARAADPCPDGSTDFSYNWTGLDGDFPNGGSLTPTVAIAPYLELVGFYTNTRCIGAAIWNFSNNDNTSAGADDDLWTCPDNQEFPPHCNMLVAQQDGTNIDTGVVNDCDPRGIARIDLQFTTEIFLIALNYWDIEKKNGQSELLITIGKIDDPNKDVLEAEDGGNSKGSEQYFNRKVTAFSLTFKGSGGVNGIRYCRPDPVLEPGAGVEGDPHVRTLDGNHYLLLNQGTFSLWRFSGPQTQFHFQGNPGSPKKAQATGRGFQAFFWQIPDYEVNPLVLADPIWPHVHTDINTHIVIHAWMLAAIRPSS
eukprot:s712_g2.t1